MTEAATAAASETDPRVVTDERAAMLAAHAIHVQGGYSTPEVERARAEVDIVSGNVPDWGRMQAEVNAALLAKVAALPETPAAPAGSAAAEVDATPEPDAEVAPQSVSVVAVLANVDAGAALRDRIKEMQRQLKVHEDAIKDVLGPATEGIDAAGNVVVRFPFRNRSDLDRRKVKDLLTPEQYAECVRETAYRALLYGES